MCKNAVKDHSTDELITWRNAASERVTESDLQAERMWRELECMGKAAIKDRTWIANLNREINRRAFGYKKNLVD